MNRYQANELRFSHGVQKLYVSYLGISSHALTMSNANHPLPKKKSLNGISKTGIGDISGVGGMSLHGMNELVVSLYVDIFDSNFFFEF